jgi:hypothetical protein
LRFCILFSRQVLSKLSGLASNLWSPCLPLPSSWEYRPVLPSLAIPTVSRSSFLLILIH